MAVLSVEQMKLVEKLANEKGLSYKQMMDNAGRAVFKYITDKYFELGRSVTVFAGNGNNGGDGFVLAALLQKAGWATATILCCGEPKKEPAASAYASLVATGGRVISGDKAPVEAKAVIDNSSLIVDCVFGTGFHGELPPLAGTYLNYANRVPAIKIAVDIPSGMDADSGETAVNTFTASETLMLAAYKNVYNLKTAAEKLGKVVLLDIGIPKSIIDSVYVKPVRIDEKLVKKLFPTRIATANKGTYGRLLNVAGSVTMSGAAMMSTLAALRSGVGITVLAAPDYTARLAAPQLMEAITIPLTSNEYGCISKDAFPVIEVEIEKASAVLVGCGMTVCDETKSTVDGILKTCKTVAVIDADGLNSISAYGKDSLKAATCKKVITPHIGEMARLLEITPEDVAKTAPMIALAFAKEYGCTVVLKSNVTYIASPNGEIYENIMGNAGLAKGGSGDVLAGMISAFCAMGIEPTEAAICAVYMHGLSAEILAKESSLHSMLARDIIETLPAVMQYIEKIK